jgi:uncharacterized membrane protein
MITLAGVVFSMTLVVLSLASSQLGPRLLRNFMRDTTTQAVLGTFVSTFLYCLLVLRTIRRAEDNAFVPHLSVALGVFFAVLSVGVVIYFIHHVSISIQVNESVARVANELVEELDRLFPHKIGETDEVSPSEEPDAEFLERLETEGQPVGCERDGYVQFIDFDALVKLAKRVDVVFRLEREAGDYTVAGRPLVLVWPSDRVDDALRTRVNAAFVLGNQRTMGQDIEFGLNQLVEVAVRALSPGLNDPFTAVACVDHIGSALCRLAARERPSPYRRDNDGKLRAIARFAAFPTLADAAFNQIRQYSRSSPALMIRLLETIAVVADFVQRPEDRAALVRHADMIVRGARQGLSEPEDLRVVDDCYLRVIGVCGAQDCGDGQARAWTRRSD